MTDEIYRQLFMSLKLTDQDRALLKSKRGFTDETIDECQFKSAHPENDGAVLSLLDSYTAEQLQGAGLGFKKDGGFEAVKQITEPGILIPFFSWRQGERDTITYFRAHKYGLPGIMPSIYMPPSFDAKQGYVVLAESEFKAAAAAQMGIPAIGLCGISMYVGDNFGILEELIRKYEFKRAVILWDNDDKANPKSKKYKPEAKARYDVEYYAYIMSLKISKEDEDGKSVDCKIATLPDDWRVDGGCDIDGALAAGHTAAEFQDVIAGAVSREEYHRAWSKECRSVCKPKLDRYFFYSPVKVEMGHYVRVSLKGILIALTNFTLAIAYNHHVSEQEVVRGVHIINEEGKIARTIEMDPSILSSAALFRERIIATGEFFFKGNQSDLDEIYHRLCVFGTDKVTKTPYRIGYTEDAYLFHNVVIKDGETFTPAKKNDPIMVGEIGYKPKTLYAEGESSDMTRINLCLEDFDYREAMLKTCQNWSGNETVLGIGWAIASIFADAIYDEFHSFPLLFVGGIKEGGKTSYCEFISSFHAVDNQVNNADEITKVALSHMLRYFSNIIVWVDEYRPTDKMTAWEGYLRSIYNRQGAAKGLKDSTDQIRKVPVYGTLMLSGEAMPSDSALNTRIISVNLDKRHIIGQHYQWLCANRYKFSRAYVDISRQREKRLPELLKNIRDMRAMISKQWALSDRHALNYSIIISALEMFCPEAIPGDGFLAWCMAHAQARQIVAEEDHIMSQFLNDISALKMNKKLHEDNYDISTEPGSTDKVIYLHLKSCYNQWSEFRKNIGQPIGTNFNCRTLSTYARNLGWKFVSHRLGRRSAYCISIQLKDLKEEETRNNFMVGEFDFEAASREDKALPG